MRIREVLSTAKVIGRLGYEIDNGVSVLAFSNSALRRLAIEAKPMALLSNTSNAGDIPLVWLDDCNFIRKPDTIEEEDLVNNSEIVLDECLFDAFVYAILTTINPDDKNFFKQYTFYKNAYRESVFNDGLR